MVRFLDEVVGSLDWRRLPPLLLPGVDVIEGLVLWSFLEEAIALWGARRQL